MTSCYFVCSYQCICVLKLNDPLQVEKTEIILKYIKYLTVDCKDIILFPLRAVKHTLHLPIINDLNNSFIALMEPRRFYTCIEKPLTCNTNEHVHGYFSIIESQMCLFDEEGK